MSSRYINLYDPALRRQREWLTAGYLAAVSGLLLVVLVAWGAWVRSQAAALETEAGALAAQVKSLQDQSLAIGNELAGRKPDPRLEQELSNVRALLGTRGEILARLGRPDAPAESFAEFLRGLARQTVPGLWLTGFSVGARGTAMEIRGRMLEPALLPQYIRRLNGEKAFQGRAFSALQVTAPVPEAPARPAGPAPFHEFSLAPARTVTGKTP